MSTEDKNLIIHAPSNPQQYYYIKNRHDRGYVMALNGNIDRPDQQLAGTLVVAKEKLLDKTIAQSQLWYLEDAGDGYCYIVSKQNGFVLDIQGAQWDIGTATIIWPKNSPPTVIANQKWKIYEKEGVIVSQLNGQAVTVQQPQTVGSKIVMAKRKGQMEDGSSQQWVFEPV